MYYLSTEIFSLNQYIDFILSYRKNNKELWYRGQSNNNWRLDSTLGREKVLDISKSKQDQIDCLKYKYIVDFNKELTEFVNNMKGFVPSNFNKFHMMFLGQHYGLKTPALDWSTDPLVGLFFALDDFDGSKGEFPVVFILDPGKLNARSMIRYSETDSDITEPFIIDDLSDSVFDEWLGNPNNTPFSLTPFAVKSNFDISHRISRQSGVFTLMDTRQPLNYPWIQTTVNNEPIGVTIKINPSSVNEMKQHLELLDISKKTIYGNDHKDWDLICNKIVSATPRI